MGNNSKLVSKIMFIISLLLFAIFVVTVLFGGQKIGGSIYFIFFVVSLTFAFLDRKYNSNYMQFYRYSKYLDDLINIMAVGSIIYYRIHSGFFIAILCLVGVGLFIDLFSKDRKETRRLESIIASILNCVFMFAIFPFFFFNNLSIAFPIIAVVVASVVDILKLVLAVVPFKGKIKNENNEKTLDEEVLDSNKVENDLE